MKDSYWLPERLFWSAYLLTRIWGQQQVPYWSREKLEKVQNSRVRKIVSFASRHVPYYRKLFQTSNFRQQDFRTIEDLNRLPVLKPLQVRKNPGQFRPDGITMDTLKLASSGTTGVPRWVHHDVVSLFNNVAHGERNRFYYSHGQLGSRNLKEAVITVPLGSAMEEVQHYNRTKAWIPWSARIERKYFSMLDSPESIIRGINEFKPDAIWSYGSGLNLLFEEVFRSGCDIYLPKFMVYTSDSITIPLKRKIIKELGTPIFSIYGSVECLNIGFECTEHQGYHLNEDCYPVRIVDDCYQPLPDGEVGRVVVSNLVNRATVLLNYELGDEGKILPGKCGCGRTQRMLSLNISRVADRLTLEDGELFDPIRFAEAVYHEKDLWQHQVVQKSGNEFELFLVADPAADKDAMKNRLIDEFEKWFQGKIRVDMRFVDHIELTPGGKQRAVVLKPSGE